MTVRTRPQKRLTSSPSILLTPPTRNPTNGKPTQNFPVTGYEALRSGRGQLILSGTGTDNDKPSETRVTLSLGRNLIDILEEVRPAGSTARLSSAIATSLPVEIRLR